MSYISKKIFFGLFLALLLTSQNCLAQEDTATVNLPGAVETSAPPEIAPIETGAELISQPQEFPTELLALPEQYMLGKIEKVEDIDDMQETQVRIINGEDKGKLVKINYGEFFSIREIQKVKLGEKVIVTKSAGTGAISYSILDKYRTPSLWIIGFIFVGLSYLFGKKKAITAILGLMLSFAILIKLIIPGITAGHDPFVITVLGSFFIAFVSIYMAHGFEKRTTIALMSTLITLVIAIILGMIFVATAKLTGAGSEDAYLLQIGFMNSINLRGLLLSGIIIGALGVLDDVTTAQVAAVEEIHKADPSLGRLELYKRGLSVGREHISSMINTLVLAYAGAAFPLLIIFSLESQEPFWITMNHEYVMEEIIRALVGSCALILAVPIATGMAAKQFSKKVPAKPHRYKASLFD